MIGFYRGTKLMGVMGVMGVMGGFDLGLVLGLVLADCDSFLVLVVGGFGELKGTGLEAEQVEMDWTGLDWIGLG